MSKIEKGIAIQSDYEKRRYVYKRFRTISDVSRGGRPDKESIRVNIRV